MLDVLIIGAGPAGLAAGIAAKAHGLRYLILEKASLVNSLLHYPTNMVFFTTPELLEIGGLPFVTPYDKPTRQEALRYYRRVADASGLEIAFWEPVTGLRRGADGPFRVTSQPAAGEPCLRQARTVILATGAYDWPNLVGVPGEDLPHVSHYYREPHPYYRRRVVVVGGKNSAADAALDLYRNGARVTLVHRGERLAESVKYWVLPDIENRIKEGSIEARFSTSVVEISREDVVVDGPGGRSRIAADGVLLLTGYHSDPALLRTAGADIDPTHGAPFHHPDTFETSVPDLFVIGACVVGRESGRVFIENGRFHGAMAVKEIARRLAAAQS